MIKEFISELSKAKTKGKSPKIPLLVTGNGGGYWRKTTCDMLPSFRKVGEYILHVYGKLPDS